MKTKTIGYIIWTIVVIAALIFVGIQVTKDRVYIGTKHEFSTDRTIQIDANKVTFQAASSDFFVLRKVSGETIIGSPAPAPLRWSSDLYFTAGPQEVPGGTWLFAYGTATVNITSDRPVTVRLIQADQGRYWVLIIMSAFLVWILGIFLNP